MCPARSSAHPSWEGRNGVTYTACWNTSTHVARPGTVGVLNAIKRHRQEVALESLSSAVPVFRIRWLRRSKINSRTIWRYVLYGNLHGEEKLWTIKMYRMETGHGKDTLVWLTSACVKLSPERNLFCNSYSDSKIIKAEECVLYKQGVLKRGSASHRLGVPKIMSKESWHE